MSPEELKKLDFEYKCRFDIQSNSDIFDFTIPSGFEIIEFKDKHTLIFERIKQYEGIHL
jgi:hypothetical protein